MNDQLRSGLDRLDINLARRIDKICRRFEADWRAGRRPASGDYLGEVPHEGRSVLLEELEAVECELREAGKERPRTEFTPSTTVAEAAIIVPASQPTSPIAGMASPAGDDQATAPACKEAVVDLGFSAAIEPGASSPGRIRYFGDYEIIREIAHGAMGVVFQARQVSLNRPVALKMILAGQLANDADVQGDSGRTASGQIIGTASYMPPEQAGSKRGEVGPTADVYALGATLYCLVTGHPPFQAASAMDTVLQVINDDPVSPRSSNPAVDRDIDTICLRCLEKDPGRRYGSAAALAEVLRRYLDCKPITARPVGAPERPWRWARRKPALSGALGGMALLLVAIAAIATFSAGRLKVERDAVLKKTARGSRRPGRGSARCTRSATAAHLGGNEPGMTPGPAPAGRGPSSARDPGRALALDPSRLKSRSCSFPGLRGATGQAG
jgi:hypothetical protein